ncbi:MotA/TolQ/ExbB proton channel family protein [Opitutales bacterium]|nr:MotA/TolQ/ExbB proton channel family protein [Opitutales bacterium]
MNNYRLLLFLFVCAVSFVAMPFGTDLLAQGDVAAVAANVGGTQPESQTLLDLIAKGGMLMIPIGLCSVVAVYVAIWQFLALRRDQLLPSGFRSKLRESLGAKGDDIDSGLAYCEQVGGPVSQIFKAGIPKIGKGDEVIEKAIEDAGAREVGKMKRQVRPLSAVATISPLLGLLGTVYGMIGAFQAASAAGAGKADTLATGIYEALVTTAAGLTLAIPVLICHQILTGKIDSLVDEVDDIAVDFLEHVGSDGSGDKKPPARKPRAKSKAAAKSAAAKPAVAAA